MFANFNETGVKSCFANTLGFCEFYLKVNFPNEEKANRRDKIEHLCITKNGYLTHFN